MKHYGIALRPVVAALVLMISPFASKAGEALSVFVSVPPQRYFVERVGGDSVEVQTLVKPGQSPATYEPTPQQMAGLGNADVFFRIGVPFERSWIDRIQAVNPSLKVVDLSEGLASRSQEGAHAHGSGDASDIDPHVWTSPPLVIRMVERIAAVLSELDGTSKSAYQRNAQAFIGELRALDSRIRESLEEAEDRAFMVYHPAWGYFAETYGLEQVAIEAGGREPGPRRLATTIERAREAGVQVIFVQPQFSRSDAEAVARAVGAQVVSADPLAVDYIANMRRVSEAFVEALR